MINANKHLATILIGGVITSTSSYGVTEAECKNLSTYLIKRSVQISWKAYEANTDDSFKLMIGLKGEKRIKFLTAWRDAAIVEEKSISDACLIYRNNEPYTWVMVNKLNDIIKAQNGTKIEQREATSFLIAQDDNIGRNYIKYDMSSISQQTNSFWGSRVIRTICPRDIMEGYRNIDIIAKKYETPNPTFIKKKWDGLLQDQSYYASYARFFNSTVAKVDQQIKDQRLMSIIYCERTPKTFSAYTNAVMEKGRQTTKNALAELNNQNKVSKNKMQNDGNNL